MSRSGDNLPEFRSVQLDFAAHIRNPDEHPKPADVEQRRMQIYIDLFYNNIKNFLDSAFPVARKLLGEERWRQLAREFVHLHSSESPYFLQISQEFLTFLHQRGLDALPPFLLELCHYEWVEMALDVACEPQAADTPAAADGMVEVSAFVRPLVYQYPVHRIGEEFQPQEPPAQPTYLLVYRTPELAVRFMESNPVTHRLLDLLRTMPLSQAFECIAQELSDAGQPVSIQQVQNQGNQIITRFREAGIIA